MSNRDRSHLMPEEDSNAFYLSLGRITIYWGTLDRELALLLEALLGTTESQTACLCNELPDVASRCRLIKSLSYTLDVPQVWRNDLASLCNRLANDISPLRNRYMHDIWVEDRTAMRKIDRRAKITKAQAFKNPELRFDTEERITVDDLDTLAMKIFHDATNLATARFDIEYLKQEGLFPSEPNLQRWRVDRTPLIKLLAVRE